MHLITEHPIRPEKCNPKDIKRLLGELRESILRLENPVQRTLGMYELRDPSTDPLEQVQNRATEIKGFGLFGYTAKIVKDRVGTDFMTNRPVYRAREIILPDDPQQSYQ